MCFFWLDVEFLFWVEYLCEVDGDVLMLVVYYICVDLVLMLCLIDELVVLYVGEVLLLFVVMGFF